MPAKSDCNIDCLSTNGNELADMDTKLNPNGVASTGVVRLDAEEDSEEFGSQVQFACEPSCDLPCCVYTCEFCEFTITDTRVRPCHVAIEKPDLCQIKIRLPFTEAVSNQDVISSDGEASREDITFVCAQPFDPSIPTPAPQNQSILQNRNTVTENYQSVSMHEQYPPSFWEFDENDRLGPAISLVDQHFQPQNVWTRCDEWLNE